MPHVLLVEDDQEALLTLSRLVASAMPELRVLGATTPTKALEIAREMRPSVVILDLVLTEREGVESGFRVLQDLLRSDPSLRVIVLTGHGSAAHGVRALTLGAAHFLSKPADRDHLCALVRDALAQSELRRAAQANQIARVDFGEYLIPEGSRSREFARELEFAASTIQPLFISGETGTGKSLCARAIHRLGVRRFGRFVVYQPTVTSVDLVMSDLFGHVKGAFTGASEARKGLLVEANGGTLFLDELDELPLEAQVALLGVLQDRRFRPVGSNQEVEVDIRFIAASNRDVQELLASGKLRRDLYHRVSHLSISLPSLRERKEDILPLADRFLEQVRLDEFPHVFGLDTAASQALLEYDWPGNVRELQSAIHIAAARASFMERGEILREDLRLRGESARGGSSTFHDMVAEYKRKLVNEALVRCSGNQVQAAKSLSLDRSSFRRIMFGK